MSYVRTHDNVYEVDDNVMLTSLPPQYATVDGKSVFYDDVIDKSKYLWALLDEGVIYAPHYLAPFIAKSVNDAADISSFDGDDSMCLGMIWVIENGLPILKPVAIHKKEGWKLL